MNINLLIVIYFIIILIGVIVGLILESRYSELVFSFQLIRYSIGDIVDNYNMIGSCILFLLILLPMITYTITLMSVNLYNLIISFSIIGFNHLFRKKGK